MKQFIALFLTLVPAWASETMICFPQSEERLLNPPLRARATTTSSYEATMVMPTAASATAMSTLTKAEVIPVVRDGTTCPVNTDASAQQQGECRYGLFTGVIPSGLSGKCCFHNTQDVFLYSVAAHGKGRTDSEYILDGRPCCNPGTEGTALVNHKGTYQCEYGKYTLEVPKPEYLNKCCWDTQGDKFKVHMREFKPIITMDINKDYSKRIIGDSSSTSFEDVGLHLYSADVYGYYIAVKAKLWADGYIDWSQDDTFNIHLDRDWKVAKNWYPGSVFTGHVSIDVLTKINDDGSMDLKVHITGTGLIFGRLEETIGPYHLDDKDLKDALSLLPLC
ncbi:hypothetical protein AJ79_03599 [Helicocarpus griseus UAMH5409]|uniref:Expansin-like EG45 domain-containing protein n=1 Tax=Helicocarpus griseus UAMH5409 TaxID=1447875 RepID=A0A2B7XX12_9EURO|nr:hypothetical protein AJ79_03599 [Helicocarpus griseus UAMH5409]